MTDVRKNLIIMVFLLAGIFLVLLFLNFNQSWKNHRAQISESQNLEAKLPSETKNLPKKISRGAVDFFDLKGYSDKVIFYEKLDSIIYEAEFDGLKKKELVRIPDASEVIFGPAGKNLIAAMGAKKFYFDLEKNQRTKLNPGIKSAALAPSGNKLAYYFHDGQSTEGNISVSSPDGSDFRIILKTRMEDLKISWPDDNLIIFYSKNDAARAFSLSPENGRLRRLSEEESLLYLDEKMEGKEILEDLGIEALKTKLSPFKDYLIFVNAGDGKLYSLFLN